MGPSRVNAVLRKLLVHSLVVALDRTAEWGHQHVDVVYNIQCKVACFGPFTVEQCVISSTVFTDTKQKR